jgi:hypothetical protein
MCISMHQIMLLELCWDKIQTTLSTPQYVMLIELSLVQKQITPQLKTWPWL